MSNADENEFIRTSEREIYAWTMYDLVNAGISISMVFSLPLLFDAMCRIEACGNLDNGLECDDDGDPPDGIHLKLIGIRVESMAFFMVGISVIGQAISFISFGAMADNGDNVISFWRLFTIIGSGIYMIAVVFALIGSRAWWCIGLLTIVGNIIYGCSIVFYNAHLGTLIHNLRNYNEERAKEKTLQISNSGAVKNYVGQFVLTLVTAGLLFAMGGKNYDSKSKLLALGIATTVCAVVWLVGGLFWISKIPHRVTQNETEDSSSSCCSNVCNSWRSTCEMLAEICRAENEDMWNVKWFIIAYFFFSDAYGTVGSVGILLAQQELKATTTTLGICLLESIIFAAFGIFIFRYVQNRFECSQKRMLEIILMVYFVLCIFGIFVYETWQLFCFVAVHGSCVGAVQSYARSLFAQCVPEGEEGKYFGIYEITDRGSSWLGPMITGILATFTTIRWAFAYIMIVLAFALVVLCKLPDDLHAARPTDGSLIGHIHEKPHEVIRRVFEPDDSEASTVSTQSDESEDKNYESRKLNP